MRDPERLFSSNGITDFERELIGAAKNEPVPDALREQMESALGLPGGAGAGAGAPRMAHAQGVVGVKAATVLWVSAGVIALGFAGGILGARFVGRNASAPSAAGPTAAPAATSDLSVSTSTPKQRIAPLPSVASEPAPARASASPSVSPSARASSPALKSAPLAARPARAVDVEDATLPSRAPALPALPSASSTGSASSRGVARSVARPRVLATRELKHARATTTPATRRDPPATADDLRGEIDLIDAARGALRTGTATRALELLGRYAARFPHGSLAPEGTALRVEALMRLGRSAEARAIARRFVAANPTSPLVERMNSLAR